jgi:hypothetical protein
MYFLCFQDAQIHYNLYYFDIQNPDDILIGAKPIVAEIGPFAYNEYYYKFDIEWSDGGDTVTYYNQRFYTFDQSRTGPGLTEFTEVTIPYSTVSGFQYILAQVPVAVEDLVDVAINVSQSVSSDDAWYLILCRYTVL